MEKEDMDPFSLINFMWIFLACYMVSKSAFLGYIEGTEYSNLRLTTTKV